ncbi:MAG: hypothetical protein ACRD96_16155, partial [Bryobacteraceae bacterium]
MNSAKELVRHFFRRFFDNELVAPGGEMQVTITQILAALAVPGLVIPFFLMPRYVRIAFLPDDVRELAFQMARTADRFIFVNLSFVVIGFVTVLEWDALFPDRRDARILTPLPVPLRTIFAAKLAALAG